LGFVCSEKAAHFSELPLFSAAIPGNEAQKVRLESYVGLFLNKTVIAHSKITDTNYCLC